MKKIHGYIMNRYCKKCFIWNQARRFPQISKMESVAAIVNMQKPLTIVTKLSILDACGHLGYAFGFNM